MPDQTRVPVADRESFVRQGSRLILGPDPQFLVMAELGTGRLPLRIVVGEHPGLVLLDRQLPAIAGLDLCRNSLQFWPLTALLILTILVLRSAWAAQRAVRRDVCSPESRSKHRGSFDSLLFFRASARSDARKEEEGMT